MGLALGLAAGGLSVWSLWLVTGFTARASSGLVVPVAKERPSGWDAEAQDLDVITAGQWLRARREEQADPPSIAPSKPLSTTHDPRPNVRATLRLFFAFLLKALILVLIALVARSLGTHSLYGCVGGVVLVYSLAVLWAAGRTHRP